MHEIHENREQLLQDIGETRNEIEKLASNNELIAKQTELETLKQQLQSLVQEWTAYRGVLVLIDAAKQKFEKNRQPGVIRSAENLFTKITGGSYPRIIKPIDQEDLMIENELHLHKAKVNVKAQV